MYREIAAKTLIGKGKLEHTFSKQIFISKDISKTLGCWIINLQYETILDQKQIFLKGSYDLQLWYASNNNQKSEVYTETVYFDEKITMSYRDLKTISEEIIPKVYVNKYPTCTGMTLDGNGLITLTISSLFYVDAFSEAILVVDCKDDYKEDISLEEEITMNVNPNYIIDKK